VPSVQSGLSLAVQPLTLRAHGNPVVVILPGRSCHRQQPGHRWQV